MSKFDIGHLGNLRKESRNENYLSILEKYLLGNCESLRDSESSF